MRNLGQYPVTRDEKLSYVDELIATEEAAYANGERGFGNMSLAILREIRKTIAASELPDLYPTEEMLNAGVRVMQVSTHADKGVALDVWNEMHRAA